MSDFSKFEEKNIILLALDSPDFFYRIMSFMKSDYFEEDLHKYIMKIYQDYFDKYDQVPSRDVLKDIVYNDMKGDDELSDPVIELLDEEIDPRNYPYIKDKIIGWAKKKQLSMLLDEKVIDAMKNGDTDIVEKIVNDAAKISDVVIKPFRFFDDVDSLFVREAVDHFTTGFSRLDMLIHDGGIYRREITSFVAPTGVGKSIVLVNSAIANVAKGWNVLHVTLENSEEVTGCRYLGAFTESIITTRFDNKDEIKNRLKRIKASVNSDLFIIYFPTDTVTVAEIELAVKECERRYNFRPDVLVVDYLECLLSKNPHRNREEYSRQKAVSAELRALAATTNTCIFTASQTNRSGHVSSDGEKNIDLDKLAESFGKAMPLDYIISINQSKKEYEGDNDGESHIGHFRFFVAKNRNGPKFKVVNAYINYLQMKACQEDV